ncbi:transposase [Thalassotalea ponticola]|uniref:transposase n=1 Tax=Thalassotalea ponticola TaxID=1523392 RepID=UPI0025B387B6|nr:transposase [Thalassotalea ponticola]MDN3651979.1 transposase [Thalassotalea ponticola]
MPKKTLSAEFKRECAELVIVHGYKHKDAAAAMNVGLSSIQRWVSQYEAEQTGITPKASALTPEQIRIQELEKQVKQLKSDNALLKKASAFFAMEMNNVSK